MGKHYFEFLEEEYQRLTSDVQEALKHRSAANNQQQQGSTTDVGGETAITTTAPATKDNVVVDQMFSRCYAVYQQMKSEVRKAKRETPALGREFHDRLHLYSLQLTALQDHYHQTLKQQQQEETEEIVFDFTVDD
jgi:hypothetical protein